MWLLDFNQCGEMGRDDAGVVSAVEAFWQNDPYYPRPVRSTDRDYGLWEGFREEYLRQSALILGEEVQLANAFIDRVVGEAERRYTATAGPPRGGPPCGGRSSGGLQKEKGGRNRLDVFWTLQGS